MATEGNARRLPSWMVGDVVAADNKASDKEKKKSRKESKGQVQVDAIGSGSRRRTRGTTLRYRSGDDGIDDQFDNDAGIGVRTKKKGKHKSAKVGADGSVSGDCTGEEEDVDLTVEDLVSIAEEYVKADKDAKKEQLLEKEHESWRRLPMAHSSQNVSEASVVVPDIEQTLEESFCAAENPSSKQSLLSTTVSTGDPARDMLDLFLGPLLKKPVDNQKNTNFGGNNLDFAFELVRQSQNNVGEDIVPPMKKKGSFKDKVSSLLG